MLQSHLPKEERISQDMPEEKSETNQEERKEKNQPLKQNPAPFFWFKINELAVPLLTEVTWLSPSLWEQRHRHRSSQAQRSPGEEQGCSRCGGGGGYLQVHGEPGEARHCCQAHILPAVRWEGGPGGDLAGQTRTSSLLTIYVIIKHLVHQLRLKRPQRSSSHCQTKMT